MTAGSRSHELSVFLNVPYDIGYERNFIALLSTIVSLGRIPRCVLEIPEFGEGRLLRILQHLESCRFSIHDLSRVGVPVRFNMPFELGLACALSVFKERHSFVLLEKEPYRLDRTLSDLKGRDPLIHGGRPQGVISCVLDVLGNAPRDPSPDTIHDLSKVIWKYACELKNVHRRDSIFHRSIYNKLVVMGTRLANRAGFISLDPDPL